MRHENPGPGESLTDQRESNANRDSHDSLASQVNRAQGAAHRLADAALIDRRGGAAVEFALLVPVMATMMLGTIQFASLIYTQIAMTGAARTAVRAVAIGSQNPTTAEATARASLPAWVPAADYVVTITDAAAGAEVSAQITAPSAKAAIIPYVPMSADVVARVVMIKEG